MATAGVQIIKASVLHGPKDLRTESRTITPPAPHELQISVRATGICGSDQHYYTKYANGDFHVREPLSLGHESAGVVEAVGRSVAGGDDGFKVGDRVAIEVGIPCEHCGSCSAGRYNLCKGMRFRSSAKTFPHFQGTLQERINHPARWCYRLDDCVSLAEGALVEPLSVALHGVNRALLKKGEHALVLGAGAVGLLTAAVLRARGAASITIADIVAQRVDFALANGFADRAAIVPNKRAAPGATAEEKLALAQKTAELLLLEGGGVGGGEFDVVFECTGVESCVQTSIYSCAPGGRVMLVGMGTPVQVLPMSAAALREVDLRGVFRYADTYKEALEMLSRRAELGMPDISRLVTQRFKGYEAAAAAFDTAAKPVDDNGNLVLKVLIEI